MSASIEAPTFVTILVSPTLFLCRLRELGGLEARGAVILSGLHTVPVIKAHDWTYSLTRHDLLRFFKDAVKDSFVEPLEKDDAEGKVRHDSLISLRVRTFEGMPTRRVFLDTTQGSRRHKFPKGLANHVVCRDMNGACKKSFVRICCGACNVRMCPDCMGVHCGLGARPICPACTQAAGPDLFQELLAGLLKAADGMPLISSPILRLIAGFVVNLDEALPEALHSLLQKFRQRSLSNDDDDDDRPCTSTPEESYELTPSSSNSELLSVQEMPTASQSTGSWQVFPAVFGSSFLFVVFFYFSFFFSLARCG
jgi:hypothetical protein